MLSKYQVVSWCCIKALSSFKLIYHLFAALLFNTKSVSKLGENFNPLSVVLKLKLEGMTWVSLPVLFKVWFLQNSKISMPIKRKNWLDLSKYSPGVGVFLSLGQCFCRKILPRGRAFDHLKKFPRGFAQERGVLALEIDWSIRLRRYRSSMSTEGSLRRKKEKKNKVEEIQLPNLVSPKEPRNQWEPCPFRRIKYCVGVDKNRQCECVIGDNHWWSFGQCKWLSCYQLAKPVKQIRDWRLYDEKPKEEEAGTWWLLISTYGASKKLFLVP